MSAGDVLQKYSASNSMTVTNLHSLAAAAAWNTGWESDAIDNSNAGYTDYRIALHLVTHASNRQAGEIRVYLIGPLNDSSWPDVFDGVESLETITDDEELAACAKLAAVLTVDNSASAVYDIAIASVAAVFGNNIPKKFVIFVTGNAASGTNAQFAASGSAVYWTGSYVNAS